MVVPLPDGFHGVDEASECSTRGRPTYTRSSAIPRVCTDDEKFKVSRRLAVVSAALVHFAGGSSFYAFPEAASAAGEGGGGGFQKAFGRYIKKKKYDPLETYVPTVLLTMQQLREGRAIISDPESTRSAVAEVRSLLRTGPASSLRNDLRALEQYANEREGGGGSTGDSVTNCLSVLGAVDSLLIQVGRASADAEIPRDALANMLTSAILSLDAVVGTVPSDILEKSRLIADAYIGSVGGGSGEDVQIKGGDKGEVNGRIEGEQVLRLGRTTEEERLMKLF